MIAIILAFLISFLICLLIIKNLHLHQRLSADNRFDEPQKMHTHITPRIGGVAIFGGFLVAMAIWYLKDQISSHTFLLLTISSIPIFLLGLIEDITKETGTNKRFLTAILSAGLSGWLSNNWIQSLGIDSLNGILDYTTISIIFTIFAITGLINAFNIIDGLNGLASMIALMVLVSIAYVAIRVGDQAIGLFALILAGSIFGFFLWNYPRGLIFLGDSGAYFCGFWIACLSILLINRNPTVSPWFALTISLYPITETLFSIYRRVIHKKISPSTADACHFHSLIYRRILKKNEVSSGEAIFLNSRTSPYLWLLSSFNVIPSILWWEHTFALIITTIIFSGLYVHLYISIIRFRTPQWIK
jgi:UDP-GlcNAc:undecaprenyl-phosphate/decaprenyl-phosphate GlcNAc-1-phosphate transferase